MSKIDKLYAWYYCMCLEKAKPLYLSEIAPPKWQATVPLLKQIVESVSEDAETDKLFFFFLKRIVESVSCL